MPYQLKQRTDVKAGKTTGVAFDVRTQSVVYRYADEFPYHRGEYQTVFGLFNEKRPYVKVNKFKSVVQPLNEVQMSKVEYICSPETVNYRMEQWPFVYSLTGSNLGSHPFNSPYAGEFKPPSQAYMSLISVDPAMASYLLQRAYSRMSSAEYDFGVTVGEVAETAALIAKPLGGIAKLSSLAFAGLSFVRKEGARVAVQVAKNATAKQLRVIRATTSPNPFNPSLRFLDESANHWLAYKFGVLPLVDDIGKVLEFKEQGVHRATGLRVAKAKGMKLDNTTSSLLKDSWTYSYFIYDAFLIKRVIEQHSCGLYFRNKVESELVNFMETVGFAPWQLPSLAYELIPLSFVVDRFIDIKSFVRGNLGSLSKDTFGSYCTRKIQTTYSASLSNLRWGNYSNVAKCTSSASLDAVAIMSQMARSVNLNRPNFPVINPLWRQQLTADATNLSLIWGRLRTHVGKSLS